ncbi:MAG: hypothetical protein H6642_11255 [Caldilineaceae bacterium]|nr:hypothetical protein [Caldilineaceae bacterium]MCB9138913.1 hypothetical protein [Caldilineaceae bacterium]
MSEQAIRSNPSDAQLSETPEVVAILPASDDGMAVTVFYNECPEGGFFDVGQWLPPREQMQYALRLNARYAIEGDPEHQAAIAPCPATSMRQGAGMIFMAALITGALPFLIRWIQAARFGTATPLLDLARLFNVESAFPADGGIPLVTDAVYRVVGLDPRAPAWLAAGLSALGEWISLPLDWLTVWIIYGVGVLAVSHLLGAHTTLQHFFAGTSYTCLPFLLLLLTPIPYLGVLAAGAALVWAAILYVRSVMVVTGLDLGRTLVSVIAPGALVGLLLLLGFGAAVFSALQYAVM